MNKRYSWQKGIISVAILWCVMMATLLIIMATFAQPVADQYAFMNNVRTHGVIEYTKIMYTTWSGRLIQTLGIGSAYRLFGEHGAQIVMPAIFFCLLGAAFSWLISLIFKFKKHPILLSSLYGFLLAGGVLYTTSCLFDIYLWLDAAFVYLLGIIMVVYDTALFVWLAQDVERLKKHRLLSVALLLVAMLGQTAGETSMILTLGWSFVILLATVFIKRFRSYRQTASVMFSVLMVGSLIMVLAPGLWTRADTVADNSTYLDIFIIRPLHAYSKMFKEVSLWHVAITVITAAALSLQIHTKITKKHLKIAVLTSCCIFASATYLPFVIYFYGSRATNAESRVMAIPDLGLFISAVLICAAVIAMAVQKYQRQRFFGITATTLMLILTVLGLRGFITFNQGYLAALITRSNALTMRAATIYNYKDHPTGTVEVNDAPVMIANSSATDFTPNGWVTVEWFYNSFAAYYGIPASSLKVHGEKLILPGDTPSWYVASGRTICTIQNPILVDRYYCELTPQEEYAH